MIKTIRIYRQNSGMAFGIKKCNLKILKDKISKDYLIRAKSPRQTKLCSKKHIKGIITAAVELLNYSGPFVNWTMESS